MMSRLIVKSVRKLAEPQPQRDLILGAGRDIIYKPMKRNRESAGLPDKRSIK